jgi:hypothetical protein
MRLLKLIPDNTKRRFHALAQCRRLDLPVAGAGLDRAGGDPRPQSGRRFRRRPADSGDVHAAGADRGCPQPASTASTSADAQIQEFGNPNTLSIRLPLPPGDEGAAAAR